MTKPKWEKEMEEYFDKMTDEDFRDFLEDTGYEFYKNVKTPLTGVPELDALEDDSLTLSVDSCHPQFADWSVYTPLHTITLEESIGISAFPIDNVTLDESSVWILAPWASMKDVVIAPWFSIKDVNLQMNFGESLPVVFCYDIKGITADDYPDQYQLAA